MLFCSRNLVKFMSETGGSQFGGSEGLGTPTPGPVEVNVGKPAPEEGSGGHVVEAVDAAVGGLAVPAEGKSDQGVEARDAVLDDAVGKRTPAGVSRGIILAAAAALAGLVTIGAGVVASSSSSPDSGVQATETHETNNTPDFLLASLHPDKKTFQLQGKFASDLVFRVTSLDDNEEHLVPARKDENGGFNVKGLFKQPLKIGYKYEALDANTQQPLDPQMETKIFHPQGEVRVDVFGG